MTPKTIAIKLQKLIKSKAKIHYMTWLYLADGSDEPKFTKILDGRRECIVSQGWVLKVLQTDQKLLSQYIAYRLKGGELKELIF